MRLTALRRAAQRKREPIGHKSSWSAAACRRFGWREACFACRDRARRRFRAEQSSPPRKKPRFSVRKNRALLLGELQAGDGTGNYVFLNLHQVSIRKRHPENRVHARTARNVN